MALGVFLNSTLPARAISARLGGDEFAIFLPDTDAFAALTLAKALCRGFARVGGGRGNGGTLSIGCATHAAGPIDLEVLAAVADRALYDAKRQGRNRSSHREVGREALNLPPQQEAESPSCAVFPLVSAGADGEKTREAIPGR